MRNLFYLSFLASACGPGPTIVEGSVAGIEISDVQTVAWGGRYLVMVDKPLDCIDLSWVNHTYSEGADFGSTPFAALQFTFARGNEVFEGNFSVQGAAEVNAKFLDYSDGVFDADDEYRARDGVLVVDAVADKDLATGTFDLDFGDDQALNGEFGAEWCVNLPD